MLRSLFLPRRNHKLREMLDRGALVVDVRVPDEFHTGHVEGALNIPLEELTASMHKLDKYRPIVVCCRSGIRSASAVAQLTANGFMAYNAGTWQKVATQLRKA